MSITTKKLTSLLFSIARIIREYIKPEGKDNFFSFLQFGTLYYISKKKNVTMSEIAEHLCVKPPSVTPLIDNLIKMGQIKRVPDKNDRRVIRLTITPAGLRTIKHGFAKVNQRMEKLLTKLSGKEQRDLIKILQKFSRV